MKILYIGGGYVGACSAAISADSGHEVLVYDTDEYRVGKFNTFDQDEIESVLYEKGLGEFMVRNRERIRFSSDLFEAGYFLDETDAIFMCLPTPEKGGSGETDLSYYDTAGRTLAQLLLARNSGQQSKYVLIINKSTVPIDMVGRTREIMEEAGVRNFGVGSNPEFLVEGKAVEGSLKPERIVVGADSDQDKDIFRKVYKRFLYSPSVKYIEVNPYEAAAGKLLANFALFNRLSLCFDVVGRVCEKFDNIHFESLRNILISDKRIGEWGFYDSIYAGGSCFIKDARSLAHQLSTRGAVVDIINDTLEANERQLKNFIERAETELHFNFKDKRIAILGLAFKRDTNDIRNSGALGITKELFKRGVGEIRAFDPIALENYLKYFQQDPDFKKISPFAHASEAIRGADAVIIACDWPEFRELTKKIKENLAPGRLIMDGRRMLSQNYDELLEAGYGILSVGSPAYRGRDTFEQNSRYPQESDKRAGNGNEKPAGDFFSKSKSICVVGLGYVGLPLASELAKHFRVIGFDKSIKRIAQLKEGIDITQEVDSTSLRSPSIEYTSDPSLISLADFIIIAVPTPLKDGNIPDFSFLEDASRVVGERIRPGAIVVYESTVYPGATEEICVPIIEKSSGLSVIRDFSVGYSPERVNPGDKEHTIDKVVKIVSASDEKALEIVCAIYGAITTIHRARTIRIAEAAKVIENIQRDLNISLMNELAVIFEKMDISVYEVLEAAFTKWNFLRFVPGLVGGHCIGVDPYYLTFKSKMLGYYPEVILAGRRTNDHMPGFIAGKIIKEMVKSGRTVQGKKFVIFGASFKENVTDVRNSKSLDLVREFKEYGVDAIVFDPFVDPEEVSEEYGVELISREKLPKADIAILAVAHKEFKEYFSAKINDFLAPDANVFDVKKILDKNHIESLGFRYVTL